MVLSDTDGIVAAGIEAHVEAGVLESITSLICRTVSIGNAADGCATMDRIVRISGKEPWRTLALCCMIVSYADSTGPTTRGVTHSNALAHIALCLTFLGFSALSVGLALVSRQWPAPTTVIRVPSKAWVTLALSTVVVGKTEGV